MERTSIIPLFKKGSRNKSENRRPVSLTSVICKLLERLIKDHMVDLLVRHKLLNSSQHGLQKGDHIEVLKILNGYENIDRNMFFSLKKNIRTRGHEVTLVKDQCRLDIRKYSFTQRTINEWNKLSTDSVTASSVNMSKNKVDTYLCTAGYM